MIMGGKQKISSQLDQSTVQENKASKSGELSAKSDIGFALAGGELSAKSDVGFASDGGELVG